MTRGLVLAFPSPSGLSPDDLERVYRFVADIPGAQVDVFTGRSRRTSAILSLAGHQLRVDRDGEAIMVHDASGGLAPAEDGANDHLRAALQAVVAAEEELERPRAACTG